MAPAVRSATWTLNTRATAFHVTPPGTVELVTPSEDVRDVTRSVFDGVRQRRPGEIRRRDYGWDFEFGLREMVWQPRWKGFVVLHRDPGGEVDGYVRYRAEEKWEQGQPRGVITVDDLQATSDDAYAALWHFLGNVDLVATVKAENRSPRERLPWLLTNARAAVASDVSDGLWVRLLDVPRALEARAYEREASVVLEIVDPDSRLAGSASTSTRVPAGRPVGRPIDRPT